MVFFDTNVLVYVHDQRFPSKRQQARRLYSRYLYQDAVVLSTQVLQEFFVTVTRKATRISTREAKELVRQLAELPVVTIESDHILAAIELHSRYQISFWDALIIVAAKAARASVVLSEDLGHGQVYDGVRVENPFVAH
ncbi:MAG TPA: PIN domain-containing protein [Bryobacteraceae bacterium]|nr:PIN domain-containing protein [Bryobacteraceae bacterium]